MVWCFRFCQWLVVGRTSWKMMKRMMMMTKFVFFFFLSCFVAVFLFFFLSWLSFFLSLTLSLFLLISIFFLLKRKEITTNLKITHLNHFITLEYNRTEAGLNSFANRLHLVNGLIPLNWLNLIINSFKIKCKEIFPKWIESSTH